MDSPSSYHQFSFFIVQYKDQINCNNNKMFKFLVVLCALVVCVFGKPTYLAYSAPVAVAAYPAAISHSYRSDVIHKPVIAAYAAPAVVHAPVLHAAAIHAPLAYAAPAIW